MIFPNWHSKLLLSILFVFTINLVTAQDAIEIAKKFVHSNYATSKLLKEDVTDLIVSDNYYSKPTGVHHVYLQQSYKGIKVYNAIYNLAIKNGKVVSGNHTFIQNISQKANSTIPILDAKSGLKAVASDVGLDGSAANLIGVENNPEKGETKYIFDTGGISRDQITVELFWQPISEDVKHIKAKLAWRVIINDKNSSDWWNIRVDAGNGKILVKDNFTVYCKFGNKGHVHENGETCSSLPKKKEEFSPVGPYKLQASNDYNVFDYPLESPSHGSRTIVNSPYTRFTSARAGLGTTNGWHHTSNATSFTYTRGNNVLAQEDANGNNGNGYRSDPGASLDFDYPFDFFGTPAANRDAAITNLFYWNNLIHDVLYNYGFDEPTGNFQNTNVDGLGGTGGDYVFADAQDGSGLDNANFSTPPDGTNGRMQMFLWGSAGASNLTVNSPASVAGGYAFGTADFDPASYSVTADAILVDDSGATTNEGCSTSTPFDNAASISGKIALIDRGTCTFLEKAQNAEAAGAVGVVICNNAAGGVSGMTGGTAVGIPVNMLSQADCITLKAELLLAPVNLTMFASATTYTPDGDFDNGIVAHEYGHGWSTRTTGGPGTGCLSGNEQQGEGWGDYLALMLCTDWASLSPTVASANISRGIGTYAIGESTAGGGIRPFMYSYDMANVNGYAEYANVGDGGVFSIPHGVGSIWCTILWDMTWEIIFQDGFIQGDIWDTSTMEGNVAAFKLVHEGLRLQPCAPGFVTSRDAILEADEIHFGGKYKCAIWKAFARRGVGVNADQGSNASVTDGTADYTIPDGVRVTKTADKLVYDQGETVNYTVTATCGCADENNLTIEDVLPSGLTYVAGSVSAGGTESGGTISWSGVNMLASAVNTYTYQARTNTGTASTPITTVNDDLDGSSPAGSWTASSDWSLTNNPPGPFSGCAGNGYFAPDNSSASDESLVLAFSLTGPATTLSFTHKYDTESDSEPTGGWDGGIVEISSDGGTRWTDLGSSMTANGYNNVSQSFGISMFSGNSGGCITTTVDLAGYCGDIQVRFRMLCDANTGGNGWVVDDVSVTSITGTLNTADAIQGGSSIGKGSACVEVTNVIFTPVELISFSAKAKNKSIELNWTTSSERNNEGFEIERSISSDNEFENVGWIKGNGNSVNNINYEFEDTDVKSGIVYYYRLKQIDHDGEFEYSEIRSAKIIDETEISISPNPARGSVLISSSNELSDNVSLTLRTIEGKIALQIEIDGKELRNGYLLDLEGLGDGVYFLESKRGEFYTTTKLLIK